MGLFGKSEKADSKALVKALGDGLPDYLKELKMILTIAQVSGGSESEKYPGFHSFSVHYPGDLVEKLWGHRESYVLTGITIRKKWGGVKKVEIMVKDGWFQGIKIEGDVYNSSAYKLSSVDTQGVILTPIKKEA